MIISARHLALFGIISPDPELFCSENGRPWRCGQTAQAAIESYVGSKDIYCSIELENKNGDASATCFADGKDVAAWMVSEGWAFSNRLQASRYISAEAEAKFAKRGLWRSLFNQKDFGNNDGKSP
ncbi:hypothetical protein A6A40_16600 (plasmid) [Azospirillum humicireducens]|uniref:TNase-like domain-containing protein n=2 Tax=Azospirillum humicireducens TaxID=1226968 RepID=A0A2R4VQJ0_9PROT|nr:hypothetical protein A6A40_16600 [Azospirillum humicireducens]